MKQTSENITEIILHKISANKSLSPKSLGKNSGTGVGKLLMLVLTITNPLT